MVTPTGGFSGGITSNLAGHGARLLLSAVAHEGQRGAIGEPIDSRAVPLRNRF